nr:MAG TPA: hypothetical protein [Bacteriophage sp.]
MALERMFKEDIELYIESFTNKASDFSAKAATSAENAITAANNALESKNFAQEKAKEANQLVENLRSLKGTLPSDFTEYTQQVANVKNQLDETINTHNTSSSAHEDIRLMIKNSRYVLLPATTTTLGGVKVGDGMVVDTDGKITFDGYTKEETNTVVSSLQAQVAKAGAPTERLAFVTQISANRWGWNETMSCEATIPKGVDFIRITPDNFDSPYVFQFSANKDLSLTGGNNKAVSAICASNANFKYTASDRKIKITAYNTDIGRTCIQGYKYGTAATPCIVWTEGDGTSAKDHDIDYIEIKERYKAISSDDKDTVEAVARVVKGSTYTTAGGATVTFASDGTVTAKDYPGTLVGYRYMTLTEVSEQLASTQSALADADALNLDQDYRLTLLELGVTDDETAK